MFRKTLVAILLLTCATSTQAQTRVITGNDPSELEALAANELVSQFKRLFQSSVEQGGNVKRSDQFVVLIGNPQTNPRIAKAVPWPQLSSQGIHLEACRIDGKPGVVVGGGSDVATLWAVYELGHRLGIRYLLRNDVYPQQKPQPEIKRLKITQEPKLKNRTWRTVNDFAIGPEAWGIEDHRRVLRQLAKMKFNRIMLSVYPWQPFVHYEFRGVAKRSAYLWYGEKYPVAGDIPGKIVFNGAKEFNNPHFVGKTDYRSRIEAGRGLLQAIIDESHRLGMKVGISISPLEFPKEFSKVIPGAKPEGLNGLMIRPSAQQRPDSAALKELVKTKISAYLTTYPKLDELYLTLPEFPKWNDHAKMAWQQLGGSDKLGGLTLEQLIATASNRSLIASGKRGEESIKGNIVGLAFLNRVLRELQPKTAITITSIDPALFPILKNVVPKNVATLHLIYYTARRVAANDKTMQQVPAKDVPSRLIMTLADDNIGVLSQSQGSSLEKLMQRMQKYGWDGFSTRYWMLAELDPDVHFLSRSAWNHELTRRQAHDDLFITICGKQACADRLWIGFEHLEKATNLLDQHEIGFAFPIKNMVMKHYAPIEHPKWWKEVTDHYDQFMIELYRSHDNAHPRSRPLLYYYAKRSEFVAGYLASITALREAALAKKNKKPDEAAEKLEAAVEAMYNAIDHLAPIVQDNGERGLIAVLATFGFKPLLEELDKLE